MAESFGRGAMTNHWTDLLNSDCFLIIGSNAAENHTIAFHWISRAMAERGAKLIHVDPRFTRTSAKAHIYAPMRSGTDIAFVGGMIKYVLDDMERNPANYNMEYVVEYTNAAFLLNPGFGFKDGLFTGYDPASRSYKDKSSWAYQVDEKGIPKQDKTLKDPNCVFQLLKKHYSRYDPDTVSKITGSPKDVFLEVCKAYAATGAKDKVGTIMYAMGTTQHTYGTQNISAYAILQLLLANVGLAGGGINAMRGESNVQGATDHFLFDFLSGYLRVPVNTDTSLAKYLERVTPKNTDPKSVNWWKNYPKYIISLLKAYYGDAATKEKDFGFHYLPKIQAGGNYSYIPLFEAMAAGTIKGLLAWGMNPAVSGPNSNAERGALEKLDWLVVADLWETETASFWKRPGADPKKIKTEVFLLPACASYEKEGSITNSGRWAQWRYKAIDPAGEAQKDLWMIDKIMLKLKELYSKEGGPNADAITKLAWGYGEHADPHKVAKEINGYDLATGKLVPGFAALKDDGTTSSGNWLYCASYIDEDPQKGNLMARRDNRDNSKVGLYSNWAWCWPVNRRVLYNRASVDLTGKPWDPKRPVIEWDEAAKNWKAPKDGYDVIDGGGDPGAVYPFIMRNDGVGRLFGPGLADGPFPEHYEPWESPVKNLMSPTQINPAVKVWRPQEQGSPDRFPIIATTYRVAEHWQAGAMTRNLPWLVELMPEMFVEISEELAAEKGISNGDKVVVESSRGQIQAVAVVTKRFKPFQINGKKVHEIGLPWHWGYTGLSTGDSANVLTPHIGDANTTIPEYKAFLCNIRKT